MNSRLDEDYVPTSRLDEGFDELNALSKAEDLVGKKKKPRRMSQGLSSVRFNTNKTPGNTAFSNRSSLTSRLDDRFSSFNRR